GDATPEQMASMAGTRDGRGMVDRLPEPDGLPAWLSEDELAHYAAVFAETGYTGGLNWYRNLDRNWELTEEDAGAPGTVAGAFIGGERDPVSLMTPPEGSKDLVDDLRGITMVPGAGHWLQQERPGPVNDALLAFLATLT